LYGAPFNIEILDKDKCKVWLPEEFGKFEKVVRFGDPLITNRFTIIVNGNAELIKNNKAISSVNYQFIFNSRESLVNRFLGSLKIEKVPDASAIKVSFEDPVPERATDFLDTLTHLYIQNAIAINKAINENTLSYLDNEIRYVETMLSSSEQQLVAFTSNRNIVNPESQQLDQLKQRSDLQTERMRLNLKLQTITGLYESLTQEDNTTPVSTAALIDQDPALVGAMNELNGLVQQRYVLLLNNTQSSPAVKEIDQRINQAKNVIIGTTYSLRRTIVEQIRNLDTQIKQSNVEISSMPSINRGIANLERMRDVNEKIYLFLLETRTHTMIARAGIVPDKSILEPTKSQGLIRPLRVKVLATSAGIGLVLSLLLIFLKGVYRNFINTKDDLKELSTLPVIGVIAKNKDAEKDYLIVEKFPQSLTSEAFRVIRTNLSYYTSKSPSKVILFTSTVAAEGKTFTAVNTGTILARSKKKVILVDLDLHKPKQANAFNLTNDVGVTTYIVGKNKLDEVIKQTSVAGLDIILSGPRTPNASELILDPALQTLIEELRSRYEYILIDASPVGLLSDSRELMKFADITLYVLKAGFSKKDFIDVAHQVVETNNVKHFGFVLNNVNQKNVSAGYGGGYYK